MKKLLLIQASPRIERSASLAVAEAFVAAYTKKNPDTEVSRINLFEKELPAFDQIAVQGKYAIMHGTEASEEVKTAFREVEKVIEEFKAADIYVIASPMWNFGIPYRLKHYIDLIAQPSYTFKVGENGYEGLLENKKAFLALARGGDYEGKDEVDFQKRYLVLELGFLGIKDIETVVAQPTLAGGAQAGEAAREKAKAEAEKIAGNF